MSNSATEHLGSSGLCHESRDGMQWGPARCCFVLQVFGCFFTCIERRLWKREARQARVWSQSDHHWSLAHYKASALGSTNSVLELAWCRWARKRDDWMMCIDLWVIVDTILKYLENLDTFSQFASFFAAALPLLIRLWVWDVSSPCPWWSCLSAPDSETSKHEKCCTSCVYIYVCVCVVISYHDARNFFNMITSWMNNVICCNMA